MLETYGSINPGIKSYWGRRRCWHGRIVWWRGWLWRRRIQRACYSRIKINISDGIFIKDNCSINAICSINAYRYGIESFKWTSISDGFFLRFTLKKENGLKIKDWWCFFWMLNFSTIFRRVLVLVIWARSFEIFEFWIPSQEILRLDKCDIYPSCTLNLRIKIWRRKRRMGYDFKESQKMVKKIKCLKPYIRLYQIVYQSYWI